MKKLIMLVSVLCLLLLGNAPAYAHFGMLIPNKSVVDQKDKTLELTLSFAHPFEGHGMDLVKPKKFDVYHDGKSEDLLSSLQETKVMDHQAWKTTYKIKRPGVYQFAMEPVPYWEPAEDVSIIHYTKTIVAAFGEEEGWDTELGLKTEIVPLTRPFGAYSGYIFTGQVKLDGKPVPNAEIEVEYYNQDKSLTPASEYHVTYVVKADEQGIFSFCCPRAGWWGFAALNEADYKIKDPDGKEKGVELGAVLWVQMAPWK